jgi:hypothetical protein
MEAYSALQKALTSAPLLFHPDPSKPFLLYVNACIKGIGAALHQIQMVGDKEVEGLVCFISRQLKESKKNYGTSQLEGLCLVWALEKLYYYYYLNSCAFDFITDCIAMKSLLNMKSPRRHMMRWQIAIQEWRGSMRIVHREGAKHRNTDSLSRWELPNDHSNPAADFEEVKREIPIMAISVSTLTEDFWSRVKRSYSSGHNAACLVLILHSKESCPDLVDALEEPWKTSFKSERFVLLDGLLYRQAGNDFALVLVAQCDIQAVLHECHDSITAGHLSRDRTAERLQLVLAWWPNWILDIESYCSSCDRCQKSNRPTGKRFGLLQRIEEPKSRWEVINMDFVTALPPGGKESFNTVLVIVDRFSSRARFLPCYKDNSALDIALIFWQQVINNVGCPKVIISNRDAKFTSEFWQRLFDLLGTKLSFSTAYHPQTDGLAERMIQTLEDMICRYCAFGLSFRDGKGYTHNWVSLLPALEFTYNSSKHSTTGLTPLELERGWIPHLPKDAMLSKMVALHPTAESFRTMMDLAKRKAADSVHAAATYNAERWDKTHHKMDLKVGDLVLISTVNFNTLGGNQKLRDNFVGPFVVNAFHGKNVVEVVLTEGFDLKHPTFPISLVKKIRPSPLVWSRNMYPRVLCAHQRCLLVQFHL